jgi:hypothetical protein
MYSGCGLDVLSGVGRDRARVSPGVPRTARLETFRGRHAAFLEDLEAFSRSLESFLATL